MQRTYSIWMILWLIVNPFAPPTCQNVNAPETVTWAGKLLSALAEDDSCSTASSDETFIATSACNIFVGRVLQRVYNVTDFQVSPPRPGQPFYSANEIATLLQSGVWKQWNDLGTADNQEVLSNAKQFADDGKLVVAVWRNPDPTAPGHVVLIGPGPLTFSGNWGLQTPVSASFRLNQPQKAFLGQPLACAFRSDKKAATHIWVKST